jgi:hypothetical protein
VYPVLVGRVRVLAATNQTAVGSGTWVRLDYPPVGYEGIDADQVQYRLGTYYSFMAASLAADAKGKDQKKARVAERLAAAGDIGVAVADKEALVKVTQYQSTSGPRNRFNSWYPATPENREKYLKGGGATAVAPAEV